MVRVLPITCLPLPIIHHTSVNTSRVFRHPRCRNRGITRARPKTLSRPTPVIFGKFRRVSSQIGRFVKNADVYRLTGDSGCVQVVNRNCIRCTLILLDFIKALCRMGGEGSRFFFAREKPKLRPENSMLVTYLIGSLLSRENEATTNRIVSVAFSGRPSGSPSFEWWNNYRETAVLTYIKVRWLGFFCVFKTKATTVNYIYKITLKLPAVVYELNV